MKLLKAKECTWGISDFMWVNEKTPYGPSLRFTFTWIVELEDGGQMAQSTPGCLYLKKTDGKFEVRAPAQRSTSYATYYSCQFSVDLVNMIEGELIAGGYQEKVGKNNDVKKLLKEPIVL